jgi:hypothetical protein
MIKIRASCFSKFDFGTEKTAVIIKPWICVLKHIPLVLASLRGYDQSDKIAGATKANVVVRIPGSVIQIRREGTGVARVIPIAAADKGVLRFDLSFPLFIIRSW